MISLTNLTKNVILVANQPVWWHYASCDFRLFLYMSVKYGLVTEVQIA